MSLYNKTKIFMNMILCCQALTYEVTSQKTENRNRKLNNGSKITMAKLQRNICCCTYSIFFICLFLFRRPSYRPLSFLSSLDLRIQEWRRSGGTRAASIHSVWTRTQAWQHLGAGLYLAHHCTPLSVHTDSTPSNREAN